MAKQVVNGLGVRVFRAAAAGAPIQRSVIINGALGVKQRFYEPYARALAAQGLDVVTWDYRGCGESRPDGWRDATLTDWAIHDFGAVLDFAAAELGARPTTLVGHSIGAQFLHLAPAFRRAHIDVLFTVSSMNNEFPHQRADSVLTRAGMTHGTRVLCALCGVFPAKRLGLFEDVPSGVMLEWVGWMRGASPFAPIEGNRPAAVASVSFADDQYGAEAAIRDFHGRVYGDDVAYVRPEIARVGHHGFFKPRHAALWEATWPRVAPDAARAWVAADDDDDAGV